MRITKDWRKRRELKCDQAVKVKRLPMKNEMLKDGEWPMTVGEYVFHIETFKWSVNSCGFIHTFYTIFSNNYGHSGPGYLSDYVKEQMKWNDGILQNFFLVHSGSCYCFLLANVRDMGVDRSPAWLSSLTRAVSTPRPPDFSTVENIEEKTNKQGSWAKSTMISLSCNTVCNISGGL